MKTFLILVSLVTVSFAGTAFAALPQCVDSGGTCVIGGTACCNAAQSCSGSFPNTTCQ